MDLVPRTGPVDPCSIAKVAFMHWASHAKPTGDPKCPGHIRRAKLLSKKVFVLCLLDFLSLLKQSCPSTRSMRAALGAVQDADADEDDDDEDMDFRSWDEKEDICLSPTSLGASAPATSAWVSVGAAAADADEDGAGDVADAGVGAGVGAGSSAAAILGDTSVSRSTGAGVTSASASAKPATKPRMVPPKRRKAKKRRRVGVPRLSSLEERAITQHEAHSKQRQG